jgi:hypothetical protein
MSLIDAARTKNKSSICASPLPAPVTIAVFPSRLNMLTGPGCRRLTGKYHDPLGVERVLLGSIFQLANDRNHHAGDGAWAASLLR